MPANGLEKLEEDWAKLKIGKSERVATFNDKFLAMRSRLDSHDPLTDLQKIRAYRLMLAPQLEAARSLALFRVSNREATLSDCMRAVSETDAAMSHKSVIPASGRKLKKKILKETRFEQVEAQNQNERGRYAQLSAIFVARRAILQLSAHCAKASRGLLMIIKKPPIVEKAGRRRTRSPSNNRTAGR